MSLNITPDEIVARAEACGRPGLLARAPHWGRVRLGDIAEVVNGAAFPSSGFNTDGRGMPLIRIRDVGASATATWFDGVSEPKHVVRHGDILIGMDGDFRIARWGGDDALLNQRVCRVDVDDARYNSRLLVLVLQGYLDAVWAETSSVTVKHLSSRTVADIPLPCPPSDEQGQIADLLEDHLSRLGAARSSIDLNRARAEVLRQSIIDNTFMQIADPRANEFREALLQRRQQSSQRAPVSADVELLGNGLPWPIASLEEVTDPTRVIRYGILKPASEAGDVPYVEVRDLRNAALDVADLKRTSAELDQQFAGARLRGGDVVVAVRGSFERSAVVPDELAGANISRDVVRLAPLPGIDPAFLHHWHQTSLSKRYLRRHARGVAVRGVNVGTLRAMPVPVVSPTAQAQVVADITSTLDSLKRLQTALDEARAHARLLERALLTSAFNGSLLTTVGGRTEASIGDASV